MDDEELECDHCDDGECGIILDGDEPLVPPKYFVLSNTLYCLSAMTRALMVWFGETASYVAGRGATAQKKLDAADFADQLGVFND